jgi:hypothetical protein
MNKIIKISGYRNVLPNLVLNKKFSFTSNLCSNIFNVQDEADFTNRVLTNKKPVIVDFHAMFV